jgi:hypothetical protein
MVVHAVQGIQELDKHIQMWTMDELVTCGIIAESSTNEPQIGAKQWLWWTFITLTNYVSPLLHCEIGIRNVIFKFLQDIINKHIEIYAPGEESIRLTIPMLKQIIASTATQQDNWDDSPDRNSWKILNAQ